MNLDPGIAPFVEALQAEGVETFESCEGGPGHAFLEPTIRFHGGQGEGHRALGLALGMGLPVAELRRSWPVQDGEPTGPCWELTFYRPATNPTQTEAKPESLNNQPPVSSGRVTVDLTREEAQGLADFLAHGAMDASMPVENRIRDEVAARLRAALAAARSVGEGAADE